jgi:peptidoglycan/LPS O-acetylase OafA/YrhL
MSEQKSYDRIKCLEGLRGFLAAWVLIGHVGSFTAITPKLGTFYALAFLPVLTAVQAVYVFMILSGFVIFFLLTKSNEAYPAFIFRRFFRLFPVFLLALTVGVLVNPIHQFVLANVSWHDDSWVTSQLALAQNDAQFAGQHIAWHLTMFHGLVPDAVLAQADAAFSGPGWSISTEWQFYLVAPLLFILIRNQFGFIALTILVLLCPFLPSWLPFVNQGEPIRSSLFNQLGWFYAGIVSFVFYREAVGVRRSDALSFKLVAAVGLLSPIVIIYCVEGHHIWLVLGLWAAFFALMLGGLVKNNPLGVLVMRLLEHPALQYLGKVSYPVYLLHWPILILSLRGLIALRPSVTATSAYFILILVVPTLTLLAASLVHRWVEQPGIDLARRFCQQKGRKP